MKTPTQILVLASLFILGLTIGIFIQPNKIDTTASAQEAEPAPAPAAELQPLELAPFMTTLQTFSHKLGFAILGRNQPLASFYLAEIREAAAEIVNEIPVYDSMPIDQLMVTMLYPQLTPLEKALDSNDWPAADTAYNATINACNTCHIAAQHPFLHILPSQGTPPFNQKFTVD